MAINKKTKVSYQFANECVLYVKAFVQEEYSMKLGCNWEQWRTILPYNSETEQEVFKAAQRSLALLSTDACTRRNMGFWHATVKYITKYLIYYCIKNPIYELPDGLDEQEAKERKNINFKHAESVIMSKLTTENPFYQKIDENLKEGCLKKGFVDKKEKSANTQIRRDVYGEFRKIHDAVRDSRYGQKKSRHK